MATDTASTMPPWRIAHSAKLLTRSMASMIDLLTRKPTDTGECPDHVPEVVGKAAHKDPFK